VVDKQNAYLKTQILTARPEQLTLMLFDGAIRFGEKARKCLDEEDYEASFESLSRAEQIVMELLNSLRPENSPDICRQQAGLYLFVYSKLVEANMSHQTAALDDALRVLGVLRETWAMLMAKQQENPGEMTSPPTQDESSSAVSIEG